jgi:serine/threonine protein kinase/Tfp pilus assembly protein PilF
VDVPETLRSALADRYAIERELGQGGMATVYLATDLRHERKVALKILRPELASILGGERFLAEIKTTANLQHPHILPLLDSGEADGTLFYVMPYVEGESLRDRLVREKQLPLGDALQIAREVADALGYAHAHGVVHRDIKPENVLLESGHAVLADFGIAKAIAAAGTTRLTQTGLAVGTPQYMSPEQAAGEGDLDGRSDLYSLGCVLYEMLAGEPPFTGPSVQAVVAKRLSTPAPRVSILRERVPAHVEEALETALARSRADRFATAAQFAEALTTGGHGGETSAPAAAGAPSIAVLPFLNLSGDPENEYFSDGLAEDIIDALTQVPGLRVMARTSAFAFRGKETDIREIGARLNVEHILEGSVRRSGSRLRVTAQLVKASDGYHLWSERFDREMTDVFAIQDEISQAIVEKLRLRLRTDRPLVKRYTENLAAYDLCLKARYHFMKLTQEYHEAGRRYCEQAIALDPGYALAYVVLAGSHMWSAFFGIADPRDALPRAKSAALAALRLDDTIAEAHGVLGAALGVGEYDWQGAERDFRRALELDPSSGWVRYWYANFHLCPMGRVEESLTVMRLALELNPLDPVYNTHVGYFLHVARQFEPAIAHLRHAVDLDPTFYYPYWFLSIIDAHVGRHEEAVAAAEKATELSGRTALTVGLLGRCYGLAGRTAEARQLLEELEARRRSSYVPASSIAMIHRGLGNLAKALELWVRGIEEHDILLVTSLKAEPGYDAVRSHPAYQALLRKMNLEP